MCAQRTTRDAKKTTDAAGSIKAVEIQIKLIIVKLMNIEKYN
jgi:hypothetical protein